MRILALSSLLFLPHGAHAAAPLRQLAAGEIRLALEKLGVVGSVLYVAAHPDDENTTLLSYLANERKLRAAYLSLTRGDGGQNLIGSEQGAALGLIRTQELLAARRIDGAEQFFTRARDFGFSKTPEETLRIWGKDEVLADMVWVIRRFRPDVIISRFSGRGGGHGHHTASALLVEEAFRAAADPKFRPEQLAFVLPWQARRLLWNRSTWDLKPGETLSHLPKLDVGGWNPLLGVSYGEMADASRSMHKSQGFGVSNRRESIIEYFEPLAGDAPGELLEGIDFTWGRFPGAAGLRELIARAVQQLRPEAPEAIIPLLVEIDAALDAVPDATWREVKRRDVRELIASCAGLWAELGAAETSAVPGGTVKLTAEVINRSGAPLTLEEVRLSTGETLSAGQELARLQPVRIQKEVTLARDARLSSPYWLDARPGPGLYPAADPAEIGNPESPPALSADFVFTAAGRRIVLPRPAIYKWTDPVAGERHRPLEIIPALSVIPETPVLMFLSPEPQPLRVRLKAGVAGISGVLRLELPPGGWRVKPAQVPFSLKAKGEETELVFRVHALRSKPVEAGVLRAVAEVDGVRFWRGISHIEHPHIPIQVLLPDAEVKLVPLSLEHGGTKIGYIPGAGDEVPASLRRVGYDVTILGEEALASGALDQFDAIVTGVRAYNTNERLRFHHVRLMSYVARGGTLVVQYNTANHLSKVEGEIGPSPFTLSRGRVTDEEAKVTFLAPGHDLFTRPNRITEHDFRGWVQERGLYFASQWDARYQPLLSMADPGEQPEYGSLLFMRYGRGTFVYTGLAFFRQLPAGVPGAYRLFANLIAHGR